MRAPRQSPKLRPSAAHCCASGTIAIEPTTAMVPIAAASVIARFRLSPRIASPASWGRRASQFRPPPQRVTRAGGPAFGQAPSSKACM
jgi:hypothetical protein